MKIVVLEKVDFTPEQKARFQKLGEVEFYENSSLKESKERVKNADVAIIDFIAPNDFLENMQKGSLLALMSTGYGWIDTKKAHELGISISNIPGYATEAVAEYLIGLILTTARKIIVGDKNIRRNNWDTAELKGIELKERILGIVGLGRIGLRVAEIARGGVRDENFSLQ